MSWQVIARMSTYVDFYSTGIVTSATAQGLVGSLQSRLNALGAGGFTVTASGTGPFSFDVSYNDPVVSSIAGFVGASGATGTISVSVQLTFESA